VKEIIMKMLEKLRHRERQEPALRPPSGGTTPAPATKSFGEEIDRKIEQLWRAMELGPWAALSKLSLWPAIDEAEDPQGITLRVDVPGLGPEDVDVEVSGNLLTIRGSREEKSEEKQGGFRRHERRVGSFCRTVTLPPYVSADKVEATYDKGILTIRAPRIPGEGPKRVTVKTS
jgi:HSP20 family protein